MGSRSGAVGTNDNNGVNDYDNNDDNRNDNLGRAVVRNFYLLFFLFLSRALNPTTEHAPNLIKCLLKGDVFFLINPFHVKREP